MYIFAFFISESDLQLPNVSDIFAESSYAEDDK